MAMATPNIVDMAFLFSRTDASSSKPSDVDSRNLLIINRMSHPTRQHETPVRACPPPRDWPGAEDSHAAAALD